MNLARQEPAVLGRHGGAGRRGPKFVTICDLSSPRQRVRAVHHLLYFACLKPFLLSSMMSE